jgi:hypothetical protein
MKKFNPSSKREERAVQAWQILVGAAMNRQTLTYKLLSVMMFQKEASGVLDKTLGHIAFYCDDNGLPALTSIVVGKSRGTPGHDIPLDSERFDQAREEVYDFDWYDIYPPAAEELLYSFKNQLVNNA